MSSNKKTSNLEFWDDLIEQLYLMMLDFENDPHFRGVLHEVIANAQSRQLALLERKTKAGRRGSK